MKQGPRIYQFGPSLRVDTWASHVSRIAAMEFNWISVEPVRGAAPAGDAELPTFFDQAQRAGLGTIVELRPENFGEPATSEALSAFVQHYLALGARGFHCASPTAFASRIWAALIAETKETVTDAVFIADTLGSPPETVDELRPARFDYLLNSSAWWDFSSGWLLEQYDRYRHIAPSIAFPLRDEPGPTAVDSEARARFRYLFAASFSTGVAMPMGFEYGPDGTFDLSSYIAAVNAMKQDAPALNEEGPQFALVRDGAIAGLVRTTELGLNRAVAILNPDVTESLTIGGHADHFVPEELHIADVTPGASALPLRALTLGPLEMRVFTSLPDSPALDTAPPADATTDTIARPCIIEEIAPQIDGGRHPAKRLAGDVFAVEASVFREGHDALAAVLRYREGGAVEWYETPLTPIGNDRWSGAFLLAANAEYEYCIEAWPDDFATWLHDAGVKHAARQNIELELTEGRTLLAAAHTRAAVAQIDGFVTLLRLFDAATSSDEQMAVMFSAEAARLMDLTPDRSQATRSEPALRVIADRPIAQIGAWYEFFPRSQSSVPGAHGTFADAELALPRVRDLGFDVVYLPPIHPIGLSFRKGKNNRLDPSPSDPGSPWAIGNAAGGHMAVEPQLGTLNDFDRFVARAESYGLKIALDYALQCSPDHPYVHEHPEWFAFRPDGTIKYAENPPKKYQDIVNFQWFGPHAAALWDELRDVVEFWIGHGVRIFRVDNPHTKPFAFWEWMIADIHARHPDIVFLAEAFTRPHIMLELAKVGFSQSYTYFTWRTTKAELTEYLTELGTAPLADVYRPNFFANTPDILPPFLQTGGRNAFLIRLYLAGTLGSSYGIYSGFEICENAALPGREEYADSEKYEIKQRDWDAPGNINDHIVRLNRIRREHRAFDDWRNVRFLDADHDSVLFFMKTRAADTVLVAINLDPFGATDVRLHLPLADLGYAPGNAVPGENLSTGERFTWYGPEVVVWLDSANPALIIRVDRRAPLAVTIAGDA